MRKNLQQKLLQGFPVAPVYSKERRKERRLPGRIVPSELFPMQIKVTVADVSESEAGSKGKTVLEYFYPFYFLLLH